jgi:cupin superfamily acireductone dioxygenase involved in methionine salvage
MFATMVNRIDQQDATISTMQSTIKTLVSQKTLAESMQEVKTELARVNVRLDTLTIAASAKVEGSTVSAGDLAFANFEQIRKLHRQVADCVRSSDFSMAYAELTDVKASHKNTQKKLDTYADVTDELARALESLDVKAADLEAALNGKVDKSRLSHIEAMVKKLELFCDFKDSAEDTLERLLAFENRTISTLTDHTARLDATDEALSDVDVRLSNAMTRKEGQALSKEINHHSDVIATLATMERLQEVGNLLCFCWCWCWCCDDV